MGQVVSVEAGQDVFERKHAASKKGKLTWKKLKQLKKHLSKDAAARSTACEQDPIATSRANGKDAGRVPPVAFNCQDGKQTAGLYKSDVPGKNIAPAGPVAVDSIPASAGQLQDSDSPTAAAFVHWAKAQSSSKHVSIEDFLLQHCKEELSSRDVLGIDDILAAAAAGGMVVPNGSCRTGHTDRKQTQQRLPVEPFSPYLGHVRGAPKSQCHDARVEAADGINAMRQTRDGEIGAACGCACACALQSL
eukprot:GHUV01024327.1.p1 GENE.GHUV01024327.1~~GHUV01024327.1.p1  ORF type:complete len:248 (+),score=74.24 GHUV01024327.1:206-949(+)